MNHRHVCSIVSVRSAKTCSRMLVLHNFIFTNVLLVVQQYEYHISNIIIRYIGIPPTIFVTYLVSTCSPNNSINLEHICFRIKVLFKDAFHWLSYRWCITQIVTCMFVAILYVSCMLTVYITSPILRSH